MKKTSDGHCQFLGLMNDPETIYNFPSLGNLCYRCKPPSVPLLEHQHKTCLTLSFTKCPVFVGKKSTKLPKKLSEPTKYKGTTRRLAWIIAGVGVIAVISFIFFFSQKNPTTVPEFIDIPSATLARQTITEESYQATTPNQVTLDNASNTVVAPDGIVETTQAPIPEVSLKLDTPIGGEQKFLIHQVVDGESIEQYAIQYNTNKETIVKVNYFLPVPLWINWLIIIPVDLKYAIDLPTFEAYVVIDESITVEKLAEKMSLDATELGHYNGIGSDYVLKSGNWLLIPREGYFFYN